MGFKRLEKNLIDIIKEEQAKLGFRKEEIRLYYPLISLNHFFEADDDVDEMQTRLEQFPEEVKKKLGDICVTHKKDRFCLHIPEQGSVYVHEHMAENEFIKKLVELMMNHGIKKEDILAIFQKEAKDIRAWSCTGKDEKDAMEDNLFTYYKGVEFLVLEEVGKEIDTKPGSQY